VVCLSTDKAVYPINAMGISKAMMEKVMVAASRNLEGSGTVICGTRYGNVMASRGSVIPLFVQQVAEAAYHDHGSCHDAFHDDAGRCGGFGALCLRARQ
jgi:FlaA1/EpsC-like NDP-sugar epimerase